MEELTIQPVKKIAGTVKLPGSKSLSNRILLLAALSEGTTLVKNLLVRGAQGTLGQRYGGSIDNYAGRHSGEREHGCT